MPSFAQLFMLAALSVVSYATAISPILERATQHGHHCAGSKIANEASLDVGGKSVTITSFSCAPAARRAVSKPAPAPKNVCGDACTQSCNDNAGILPPISEDCDTITAAIKIFENQTQTFLIDANHLQTLTFGTCSYFFSNSGSQQLQYCWSDLNSTASAAGGACFPPNQPFHSEGLCTSDDSTWAVGAAHS